MGASGRDRPDNLGALQRLQVVGQGFASRKGPRPGDHVDRLVRIADGCRFGRKHLAVELRRTRLAPQNGVDIHRGFIVEKKAGQIGFGRRFAAVIRAQIDDQGIGGGNQPHGLVSALPEAVLGEAETVQHDIADIALQAVGLGKSEQPERWWGPYWRTGHGLAGGDDQQVLVVRQRLKILGQPGGKITWCGGCVVSTGIEIVRQHRRRLRAQLRVDIFVTQHLCRRHHGRAPGGRIECAGLRGDDLLGSRALRHKRPRQKTRRRHARKYPVPHKHPLRCFIVHTHSWRNALPGSVPAAEKATPATVTRAISSAASDAAGNSQSGMAMASSNWASQRCRAIQASGQAIRLATATGRRNCTRRSVTTLPRDAPRTLRTPISRTRRPVLKAAMP